MDEVKEMIGECPVSAEEKINPCDGNQHACEKCKWWMKTPPYDGNNNFENIQSTNWNSLRFKIPPSMDTDIGWRVEFRPMDICVTDFENAALTIMVGMIANLINDFDLDFIIPITLVDENMKRAHMRNALVEQKFWFKTSIYPDGDENSDYQHNDLEKTDFVRSKVEGERL